LDPPFEFGFHRLKREVGLTGATGDVNRAKSQPWTRTPLNREGSQERTPGNWSRRASSTTGLRRRVAPIHPSLSVGATERPSTPGSYFAVFELNDLVTHLTAFEGTVSFLAINKSGEISEEPYPYKVKRFGF
jgi:hypothetical protein